LCKCTRNPQESCHCSGVAIWKEAKDGRRVGNRNEILHAICPMFAVEPQSVYSNFIISVIEGKETLSTFESVYRAENNRIKFIW